MWMKSSWRSCELHVATDSCSRSVLISRLPPPTMMCTSKPTSLSLYLGSRFSRKGAGEASSPYGSGEGDGVMASGFLPLFLANGCLLRYQIDLRSALLRSSWGLPSLHLVQLKAQLVSM